MKVYPWILWWLISGFALLPAVAAADLVQEQELSARVAVIAAVSGTFTQSRSIAVLPKPLESSGNFSYQVDEGLIWHTQQPVDMQISISASGELVVADQAGAQGQSVAAELVGELLLGLFSGEFDKLQRYFEVEVEVETERWTLKLIPRDANVAEFVSGVLVSGTEVAETISLSQANGDVTHIRLVTTSLTRKTR